MNKLILSIIGLMLFSSSVIAESNNSGFFIGTEVQLVTTEDKVNNENLTSSGIGVNLGYYFNRYVGLEAGYGVTDDLIYEDSFEHYDALVLGRLPLSDKFNLNFGGGLAVYNNESLPKGKIGFSYQVNREFSWDAGYTFYGKPNGWDEHIESFNFGFTYYFGQSEPVQTRIVMIPEKPREEPKPQSVVKKEPICETQLVTESYRVKKGEWLRKIAANHNMTWPYFQKVNVDFMRKTPNINIIQPGDVLKINISKEICK